MRTRLLTTGLLLLNLAACSKEQEKKAASQKLLDSGKKQGPKGANPFDSIRYGNTGRMLSSVVKAYDPPYTISTYVYDHIKKNLAAWVEEAIAIRANA